MEDGAIGQHMKLARPPVEEEPREEADFATTLCHNMGVQTALGNPSRSLSATTIPALVLETGSLGLSVRNLVDVEEPIEADFVTIRHPQSQGITVQGSQKNNKTVTCTIVQAL